MKIKIIAKQYTSSCFAIKIIVSYGSVVKLTVGAVPVAVLVNDWFGVT